MCLGCKPFHRWQTSKTIMFDLKTSNRIHLQPTFDFLTHYILDGDLDFLTERLDPGGDAAGWENVASVL